MIISFIDKAIQTSNEGKGVHVMYWLYARTLYKIVDVISF